MEGVGRETGFEKVILSGTMASKAHFVIGGALGLLAFTLSCVRAAALQENAAYDRLAPLAVRNRAQPPAVRMDLLRVKRTVASESLSSMERDAIAEASKSLAIAHEDQVTATYVEARNAADQLEEDLLGCFPFTGAQTFSLDCSLPEPQRILLNQWKAWRAEAIRDLPDYLRLDSEYRSAIHAYFMCAIRGFLNAEKAESVGRNEESIPSASDLAQGQFDDGGSRVVPVSRVLRYAILARDAR